jgi:opacity protein-like surface antigen
MIRTLQHLASYALAVGKAVLTGAMFAVAAMSVASATEAVTPHASPASVPSTPADPNGAAVTGVFGIAVKGNRFVSTQNGAVIQLIGTNISGLEGGSKSLWPQFAAAGPAFWSMVKNWRGSGINVVRLPLNEASWLNYACYDSGTGASETRYTGAAGGAYTPDPMHAYQATVKKAVADATAAGLYVILDLHWGAPNNASGQALCPIGQPAYADADHSPSFWQQLAHTFRDNPAVMLELFNEPFGDNVFRDSVVDGAQPGPNAFVWKLGGLFHPYIEQNNNANNAVVTHNFNWQVAGAQTLIDTIRAEGAANVILSSPQWWAGQIQIWLASKPTDPLNQMGVAWHVYGFKNGTAGPLAVLAAGYPVVITETYGFNAALDGGKNANGYAWAASHNIGYLWWGWNDWGGQQLGSLLSEAPWYMSTAP